MPAQNQRALNALNRVAAAYVAGISDEENMARARWVNAVPAMEVTGSGGILYKDAAVDLSAVGTGYTGVGAPSKGWAPGSPTEVELKVGENRDHADMPFNLLVRTITAMGDAGNVNEAALNYADELANRIGLVKTAKLHRQQRRVDAAFVAADSGALGTAIDAGADAVAVLDTAFKQSRGDTLFLREDGFKAFLRNASVRAAMAVSNSSKSVTPSAFVSWLNDTFGFYVPWAEAGGGIRVEVDSLKAKTDDTGSYVVSNLMAVTRTMNSSGVRPSRFSPAETTGRVRLPFGIVQNFIRPGETLTSGAQDGTLLSRVSAQVSDDIQALNYSLHYRAARKEDYAVYRHYLDDSQGVTTIDSNRLYVASGVVT